MANNDKRREQHHAVFNDSPAAKQVEVNLHIAPVEEPTTVIDPSVTQSTGSDVVIQPEVTTLVTIEPPVEEPTTVIDPSVTQSSTPTQPIDNTEKPLEIQTRADMGTPVDESSTVTDLATNVPSQTDTPAPITLTNDPFINDQLVKGLEGIKEKFNTSNMARVSDHHVDIFNAFTRAVASLPQPEFNNLLHNLLNYYNDNKDGHGASKIILQGVETSALSPVRQRDYYTMFATLHSLKDPSTRAKKARSINWEALSGRMSSDYGIAFSDKIKKCFNI